MGGRWPWVVAAAVVVLVLAVLLRPDGDRVTVMVAELPGTSRATAVADELNGIQAQAAKEDVDVVYLSARPAAVAEVAAALPAGAPTLALIPTGESVATISNRLPSAVRVINSNGDELRSGTTPDWFSTLVWALVLVAVGMVGAITLPRKPAPAPAPAPAPEEPEVKPDWWSTAPDPAEPLPESPTLDLTRFTSGPIVTDFLPQCPQCGAYGVGPESNGRRYGCPICRATWSVGPGGAWPAVVVQPRRRSPA